MKISARNQVPGKITSVRRGQTTGHVTVDVGRGITLTASITNEAIDELGLTAGDQVTAVVKASDVMIARE